MKKIFGIIIIISGISITLIVLNYDNYRQWALTWGATEVEIEQIIPGDTIISNPNFVATRAITINAAPEKIWPWLLQLGYLRAGFYSYDFLDNNRVPSSDTIIQMYQKLQVGDIIPMDDHTTSPVLLLEPNKSIVAGFVNKDDVPYGTWLWFLQDKGNGQTRLITRLRLRFNSIRSVKLMELFEIIMMRKHLIGIKERVEI